MAVDNLSVELVEALQTMVMKGKSVTQVIQNLRSATLPGIIEYGCLRFSHSQTYPPLPNAIQQSPRWTSLRSINSDIGLSSHGSRKSLLKNVSPSLIEFTTVWNENDTLEVAWDNFLQRFERSTLSIGFTTEAALNMQSALHEMATNAVLHSKAAIPALVGFQVSDNFASFSVADVGRGILASLSENPKYSHLVEPVDAIQMALRTGVTGRVDDSGGFGFSTVFKALTEAWGLLRFRSGNGCITMNGNDLNIDKSVRQFPPPLPGFQVSVCCSTDAKQIALF